MDKKPNEIQKFWSSQKLNKHTIQVYNKKYKHTL